MTYLDAPPGRAPFPHDPVADVVSGHESGRLR